jgi:sortase A
MKVQLKVSGMATARSWLERGLIAMGLFLLCYCALSLLFSYQVQSSQARDLDSSRAAVLQWTPLNPPLPIGAWRLEVERLGISVMVVEGVGQQQLAHGAGHIPGTSLPGQAGNTAVSAHRDTYFRGLRKIQSNDLILVTTQSSQFQYRVSCTKVVFPTDLSVLAPTGAETLTLVTCYPFYFLGPAPKRFIVQAERVI